MKKMVILTIVLALAVMLAFPAVLFAEEGDANSTIGVREQSGQAGQYILGDKDSGTPQPSDTINDNSNAERNNGSIDGATGDGDTEVYCIDGDTAWDTGKDKYTLTDIDVSDELAGEAAQKDDDDKDGIIYSTDKNRTAPASNDPTDDVGNPLKTDGIIDPVEAEAIEILSKEATGATSVEDQESVWLETGDNIHNRGNAARKTAVTEAAEKLATEFLQLAVNNDADPDNDMTLDEFLDSKEINEIDVTVEQDKTIFDAASPNPGTATAIMENPLVPGITDEGKEVYWYILGGAFNISFAPDELITQASSLDHSDGTNATVMNDMEDDNDGENTADNDGDGNIADDNYGIATINYYYFHWGLDEYPEGTMGINLYAWVDVDGDSLFDIVDVDPGKAADGQDPDGDVVGEFQENHQIVQTEDDGSGKQGVKTDAGGNVETEPFSTEQMDIHKIEGGKAVLGNDDLTAAEENDPMIILPRSDEGSDRRVTRQRFSTIAYDEPYDDDPIYFGTVVIKVDELDVGLQGAVFGVFDNAGASGDPLETITSDENGHVSTAGLLWEGSGNTYYIKEISAPAGYSINNTIFEIFLSGQGVSVTVPGDEESGNLPFIVENTKATPEGPEDPEDPEEPGDPEDQDTPEGKITVLAFTGMTISVPLSGLFLVLISMGILLWLNNNRKQNWKHVCKRK